MNKLILFVLLTLSEHLTFAQHDYFVFKKKNKIIHTFYKDAWIAFQLKNGQWQTGNITQVQNDSFWVRPIIVNYGLMGNDTVYYYPIHFALTQIFAMPKKGVQVDYIKGRFQITRTGGHVHWYWIKSGWIFRVGAAGYAGLFIANGLIKNNLTFTGSRLGIAAAVFSGGMLLHYTYKPVLRVGRKYHLQSIKISG